MRLKINPAEIIVIAGQTGTGKTTLAKAILKQIRGKRKVMIVDVNGEYSGIEGVEDIIPQDPKEIFVTLAKAYDEGNYILVMDEADMYFPQSPAPLSGIQYKIVHLGRHRNLMRFFITRRIADLHKDVVSQAQKIFSFYQFLPNDIDYLRKFVGDDAYLTRELRGHEFVLFTSKGVVVFPPLKIPKA